MGANYICKLFAGANAQAQAQAQGNKPEQAQAAAQDAKIGTAPGTGTETESATGTGIGTGTGTAGTGTLLVDSFLPLCLVGNNQPLRDALVSLIFTEFPPELLQPFSKLSQSAKSQDSAIQDSQAVQTSPSIQESKTYDVVETSTDGNTAAINTSELNVPEMRASAAWDAGNTRAIQGNSSFNADNSDEQLYQARLYTAEILQALVDYLKSTNRSVILIIDELGKFLHNAIHDHDIYFLQELAEIAARSQGHLICLGILHQSFDSYIHNFDKQVRDEWVKVQGRFENQILHPSSFEIINLISASLERVDDTKAQNLQDLITVVFHDSPFLSKITDTFVKCQPLYPLSALLLSALSLKTYGQNERSIFGFMNSYEPYSFMSFLSTQKADSPRLYMPDDLFDYIVANQQIMLTHSQDGHQFTQALEILHNLEDKCPLFVVRLFKTLVMINILGNKCQINATPELLSTVYTDIASATCFDFKSQAQDLEDSARAIFAKYLEYSHKNHAKSERAAKIQTAQAQVQNAQAQTHGQTQDQGQGQTHTQSPSADDDESKHGTTLEQEQARFAAMDSQELLRFVRDKLQEPESLESVILADLRQIEQKLAQALVLRKDSQKAPSYEYCIEELTQKKAIIYRNYNNTFNSFGGSDFDFESEFKQQLARTTLDFNVLEQLYDEDQLILAKRHYMQTGNLRYLEIKLILSQRALEQAPKSVCSNDLMGTLFLTFIEEGSDPIATLCNLKQHSVEWDHVIFAVVPQSQEIMRQCKEFQALKALAASEVVLNDKVANKELQLHIHASQKSLQEQLITSLSSSIVIYHGKFIQADQTSPGLSVSKEPASLAESDVQLAKHCLAASQNHKLPSCNFTSLASTIADEIFYKAPYLLNELINHNKLPTSVAGARNKLLKAMCENSDQKDLGFTKAPPEAAIYWTLLQQNGMHRPVNIIAKTLQTITDKAQSASEFIAQLAAPIVTHVPAALEGLIQGLQAQAQDLGLTQSQAEDKSQGEPSQALVQSKSKSQGELHQSQASVQEQAQPQNQVQPQDQVPGSVEPIPSLTQALADKRQLTTNAANLVTGTALDPTGTTEGALTNKPAQALPNDEGKTAQTLTECAGNGVETSAPTSAQAQASAQATIAQIVTWGAKGVQETQSFMQPIGTALTNGIKYLDKLCNDTLYQFYWDDEVNARYSQLFKDTLDFIQQHSQPSAQDIYDFWTLPPYGIKRGLHPILLLYFILVTQQELYLYEDGTPLIEFTSEQIEDLLSNAKLLTFKYTKNLTDNKVLLQNVYNALQQTDPTIIHATCVSMRIPVALERYDDNKVVVRPQHDSQDILQPMFLSRALVRFVFRLKPLTKSTTKLSRRCMKLRAILNAANDPIQLLFEDITSLYPEIEQTPDELCADLHEMANYYHHKMQEVHELLLKSLKHDPSEPLSKLNERAINLKDLSAEHEVKSFINKLINYTGDDKSVERLINGCTNTPTKDISETDVQNSLLAISKLAFEFRKMEGFASSQGREGLRNFISFTTSNADQGDVNEIIELDHTQQAKVSARAKQMESTLLQNLDYQEALGVLAELAALVQQHYKKP